MSETATLPPRPALPSTFADFKSAKPEGAIAKVRYTHDAMIDMIVANPWVAQGELARNFGYTEGWVSQVIASDAFQTRLAQRKNDLVDPILRQSVEDNIKGLVARSIQILQRKLDKPEGQISDELALKAFDIAARAAGYGAKGTNVQVQNNFVVQVPAKSASSADWEREHGAGGSIVSTSPATQTTQMVEDAVLVGSDSAAPTDSKSLLNELKEKA